ncbi:MAG: HEPN domain-containing protein [Planctomycetes bacterium]|nr:HEPN domain-containing protein [Planctomycetota bacterium]
MSEKVVSNWITLAEYDFETAQAMMGSGRYLYVAFTCHQTIEKMLKALYVKEKEETPPYSHNLRQLVEGLSVVSVLTEHQKEFLGDLNSYYIESRYTEDIAKLSRFFTSGVAESLLKRTEELFRCLKTKR